jgi:Putative transposase/Transposase zinc-binding domain
MSADLADVFRLHGDSYRKTHKLPLNQLRTMHAIEICRTKELGGHIDECEDCGHLRISYNSCRNRHCPKCQFLRKEKWLEERGRELLPIPYFHVVFTVPEEINPLALRNQDVVYTILFKAASETLMELTRTRLGAQIGVIAVLHTWGQNLMDHPHLHCIVSGGGLSPDGWKSSKRKFFLPVKVMSRLFKGKFLFFLRRAYKARRLRFPGTIALAQGEAAFTVFLEGLYRREWVVYCKPPFYGPESVIRYLGRYTHRVALTNRRLVSIEDGKVSFFWKNYADGNARKTMTLDAPEFIRRFLLHVLPDGFVKIRYFGLLSNRNRKASLVTCRALLGVGHVPTTPETWQELLLRLSGVDVTRCPLLPWQTTRQRVAPNV